MKRPSVLRPEEWLRLRILLKYKLGSLRGHQALDGDVF